MSDVMSEEKPEEKIENGTERKRKKKTVKKNGEERKVNEGGKKTQFQKGAPGGPGRGHGGTKQPSRLLRDMRKVYGQDEKSDKGPGQKACRILLKENPNTFFAQMAGLEKHWRMVNEESRKKRQESIKDDEGQVRVTELVDRLLQEWEGRPKPQ